jgi:hypothetical protein
VVNTESIDRDAVPVDELLRELDELRELDRRRHAHAPGSPGQALVNAELDARSRRLMDRFRDALRVERQPQRRRSPEDPQAAARLN